MAYLAWRMFREELKGVAPQGGANRGRITVAVSLCVMVVARRMVMAMLVGFVLAMASGGQTKSTTELNAMDRTSGVIRTLLSKRTRPLLPL